MILLIFRAEIVKCSDWSVAATINGNIKDMFFSPQDNYFTAWEMFIMTKENPQVINIAVTLEL